MTCVKTRASIYFKNYNKMVVGYAYIVHDVFIFRWKVKSAVVTNSDEFATHTVELVEGSDSWWHRYDLGVTVVPKYMVKVNGNY